MLQQTLLLIPRLTLLAQPRLIVLLFELRREVTAVKLRRMSRRMFQLTLLPFLSFLLPLLALLLRRELLLEEMAKFLPTLLLAPLQRIAQLLKEPRQLSVVKLRQILLTMLIPRLIARLLFLDLLQGRVAKLLLLTLLLTLQRFAQLLNELLQQMVVKSQQTLQRTPQLAALLSQREFLQRTTILQLILRLFALLKRPLPVPRLSLLLA
jgi:hypothetical protein